VLTIDILLYILAFIITIWAQTKVKNAYQHFAKVANERRLSGYAVARDILNRNGLYDVQVQVSQNGVLSDHYDPKSNTVNLSPKVYNDASIASVAIAAHEVGHAMQYAENYSMVGVRNRLLPLAIVSGHAGWIVLIIGLSARIDILFLAGIVMIGIIGIFQLFTLPLEFDASKRALVQLSEGGYVNIDEVADAKEMLSAAALTYVAALVATLLQIMRFVLIYGRRRN
jgi:hypothetical protein